MNGKIVVFLYRCDGRQGSAFCEAREVTQRGPDTIIGVATRPAHQPIEYHRGGRDTFEDRVEDVATEVRWFDDDLARIEPEEAR
jgi:hypothetical protein